MQRSQLGGFLPLAIVALIAGTLVGIVGGAFRWCLDRAIDLQQAVLHWSHTLGVWGWTIPALAVATCTVLAVLIVRWVPMAGGSGIQHVEAVNRGEVDPPLFRVLPARFVGGVLAIGSGLVLGREGPTVHMGAAIGAEAGKLARRGREDIVILQSSLAGAGLAVAFNAPIGGALFVFEEITKTLRVRTVTVTALGVGAAVGASWLIIGGKPDFAVEPQPVPSAGLIPMFIVFGVLTGLLGVAYNSIVIRALQFMDRVRKIPHEIPAAALGALVGVAMFIDPMFAGGGDALAQSILSGTSVAVPLLLLYLAVRFFMGPLSYATGVPGGLFAPLLAVGSVWGLLFASVASWLFPGLDVAIPLAIVGMAAFFAATVRAPLTGAVIVMEMTAVTSVAVPMLVATASAVLVATLLNSTPIYDRLRERMLASTKPIASEPLEPGPGLDAPGPDESDSRQRD